MILCHIVCVAETLSKYILSNLITHQISVHQSFFTQFQLNFKELLDGWLVNLFYGISTFFWSFNAKLNFKQFR